MTPTILITRPHDDAHILADALRSNAANATCIIAPVMEIEPLDPAIEPDSYGGVVLTSRYAVPFAAHSFRDVMAYCVGDATAAAAHAAGLNTMSASGSADDLVALLMRERIAPLAHLHGVHTVGEIAVRLTQAGLPMRSFAVYEQKEVDWTPQTEAQIVAAQSLIVPVYSPRTAALVGARLVGLGANITLVAISNAALEAWTGPQPVTTVIAKRPDGDGMRLAIASQFA